MKSLGGTRVSHIFSYIRRSGKIHEGKMKLACGNDIGVFKGDFGRCPRCSWKLWYCFSLDGVRLAFLHLEQ